MNTDAKTAATGSRNTSLAYRADWTHFSAWCRRRGVAPLPPDAEWIARYLEDCADPDPTGPGRVAAPLSLATIGRRLAGLAWHYRQRGFPVDRADDRIVAAMELVREKAARPPRRTEALMAEDIAAMVETLSFSLRDLRDRAILLLGFSGGFRRTEIVALDVPREFQPGAKFVILGVPDRSGLREVRVDRGARERACPVAALEAWLHYGRLTHGPLFRRISRDNKRVLDQRLSDRHVARLIKRTAVAANIRPDLSDREREALFSGHSLRTGHLASQAATGASG